MVATVRFELTTSWLWARRDDQLLHIASKLFGGRGEIRTHGGDKPSVLFKSTALNHSATRPTLIVGGVSWDRTGYSSVQGRCVPNYTSSPLNFYLVSIISLDDNLVKWFWSNLVILFNSSVDLWILDHYLCSRRKMSLFDYDSSDK